MTDEPRLDEQDVSGGTALADAAPGPDEAAGKKLRQTVDIKDAGPCRKHIRVEVDREDIDGRFREHFSKLMIDVAVPGYRPGKAPRKLVERRFQKDVGDQVKSEILMASLEQLGEDHEVAPLSPPDIDLEKISIPDAGPLVYEFEVEVRPEFDLPDYKGLKLRRPVKDITPAEVDELRRRLLAPHGQIVPKPSGDAQLGDILVAEVEFTFDGKEVGKVPESQFRIERELAFKDGLAPHFADQVKGAKAGDKKEVDIELSSQAARNMGGVKIKATFDIKDVKTVRLPDVTPEFLTENTMVSTPEQFEELLHGMLQRNLEHTQRRYARAQVIEKIAAAATWDLPKDLLVRQSKKALHRRLMEMQADGIPVEQIQQEYRRLQQDVIRTTALSLKEHFVLQKIAEVEKIEIDQDDINDEIERIAAQSNESPRKVRARLEKDEMMDALAAEMIERKVMDLILDQAEYEDFNMDEAATPASQATMDVQAVAGQMADPSATPAEDKPAS